MAMERAREAQGNPGTGGEGPGGGKARGEGGGGGSRRRQGRALEHSGAILLYGGSQDGRIVAERAARPRNGEGKGREEGPNAHQEAPSPNAISFGRGGRLVSERFPSALLFG